MAVAAQPSRIGIGLCLGAAALGLFASLLAGAPFFGFMLFQYPHLVFSQTSPLFSLQNTFSNTSSALPGQFGNNFTSTFGIAYYVFLMARDYILVAVTYAVFAILVGWITYAKTIKRAAAPPKPIYSFLFVFCACTGNLVFGGLVAYLVLKGKRFI